MPRKSKSGKSGSGRGSGQSSGQGSGRGSSPGSSNGGRGNGGSGRGSSPGSSNGGRGNGGSGRGSSPGSSNGGRGNGDRRSNSAGEASNRTALDDGANNNPHQLSGGNPEGLPARQPDNDGGSCDIADNPWITVGRSNRRALDDRANNNPHQLSGGNPGGLPARQPGINDGGRRSIGAGSYRRAFEDGANNNPHQLSGGNPGGLPARQPDVFNNLNRAGPSNYTGDEPGSSEGNPGGTPDHFNDGGDARFPPPVPVPAFQPAAGQADQLRNFIQTRLREYYTRPGREIDQSYVERILRDLSAYLEHPEGIASLLPAKPEQNHETGERNSQEAVKVYANYFSLTMKAGNKFILYKVSWIGFENAERNVKERYWRSIVAGQLNHVHPPPCFDGDSIVISKTELFPTEDMEFTPSGHDNKRIRVSRKTLLDADDLDKYLVADGAQRNVGLPQDLIKFANSIMKGYCREKKYVESGRYFFLTDDHENADTQRQNVFPWTRYSQNLQRRQGYFQSVRVLEYGLALNVDFSSAAFWRPLKPLREIWEEIVQCQMASEDSRYFDRGPHFAYRDPNSPLFRQQVRVANGYLRNLKITSTHRDRIEHQNPDKRRHFTIYRVEGTTAQLQTVILNRNVGTSRTGEQLSLIDLMCHRDGYKLRSDDLDGYNPALKVSKTKDYYIPWGCCYTGNESRVSGQLDGVLLTLLKRQISDRHVNIQNFRNPITPTQQETYTEISVAQGLLEVKPVTLRSYVKFPRSNGFYRFLKPATVAGWAYLSFNERDSILEMEEKYLQRLKGKGRNLGMTWTETAAGVGRFEHHPNAVAAVKRTEVKNMVTQFIESLGRRKLDLIVCFMARKLSPEYATLKFLFDIKYGIPSQVIIVDCEPTDLKIFTLLLKINVKCRGKNFKLTHSIEQLERDVGLKEQTILMGADVFHPKTDDETYSIAAVTATIDNEKISYASRLRALGRNTEIMKEILTDMVKELLKVYRENVGSYPKNIIFFRDGLSESQYLDCLRVEGTAILQAVKDIQSERQTETTFRPNVAIILAIKRHHTRFFVVNPSGTVENLREGTVVSNRVTNLKDYDFFLASQKPPPTGTIRPTHYLVLLDQIRMQPGGGQGGLYNYVYNLCNTFQRGIRGVALVTPVSYAHLAAARAKLYMQDYKLEFANQPFPQRDDPLLNFDAHDDLKNHLWFL